MVTVAATMIATLIASASVLAWAPAGAHASPTPRRVVTPRTSTPRRVARWPFTTLQLGLSSSPGQAAALHRTVPKLAFRYQYLAGGVNTGAGWQTWGTNFVSSYIAESRTAHIDPVFSYYQIRQSLPGANNDDETAADLGNIDDVTTMQAYFADLIAFYKQAASAHTTVIVQIEPDLWGHIEQAAQNQNAATVPAAVASTGIAALQALPNNASGLARAFLLLRDRYAPHLIVAYHDSIWGTELDIQSSHPSNAQVSEMAAKSTSFYRSLDAHFDAIFTETTDRDAGYAQVVDGEGNALWWTRTDFVHLRNYIAAVHKALKLPVVVWQIPLGNTLRAVENNTPYHYRDNKVQTLLGSARAARTLLRSYATAGVAALLFGAGQQTDTLAGADDGNYFYTQARHYYHLGPLKF